MSMLLSSLRGTTIWWRGVSYDRNYVMSQVDKLAVHIDNLSSSCSPFIFLHAHNHLKTVIAYFAILKAGKIAVLINPAIGSIEFEEMAQTTPPAAIITPNVDTDTFDYVNEVSFCLPQRTPPIPTNDLHDVCTIVYTAAEDGHARAAMLTDESLLANAQAVAECDKLDESSISYALLPFCNLYGLQTGLLGPLVAGASVVIADLADFERRRYKSIFDILIRHQVTNCYSIPMIFYLLARTPEIQEYMKCIKSLVSGGYKLPVSIFNTVLKKTGIAVHEGYGLTEASPICTWHRPDDSVKIQSIGRAFSCCTVKIFDNNNKECAPGERGEICIQGKNVMKGYYADTALTNRTIADGWLHSGDWGWMDGDGYVYFSGLKKKMYKVMGFNVYPAEVERLLKKYPQVIDVQINAEPSEMEGHKLRGIIRLDVPDPVNEKVFRNWCVRNISKFKIPGTMEIIGTE